MSSMPSDFGNEEYDLLSKFSRHAWGHPELFLKNGTFPDIGDIEYVDLSKYLPAVDICSSGPELSLVLVRDEYRLALQALQRPTYARGAYVTGQPGIGKTLFLVYLLVYLLGQKTAVAVQLPEESPRYAFFTNKGVTIQSECESGPMVRYPGKMWALCGSNVVVTSPSRVFSRFRPRMQVVQTTSPRASRWKQWAKHTGAERYIMDIWSTEELKKLAALSGLNVNRVVELAEKWGGVPRMIVDYCSKPDHRIEDDYRSWVGAAVRGCEMMLEQAPNCNLPNGAPSYFYLIRQQEDDRAMSPYVYVPTRTLRCFLAEGLRLMSEALKLEFFTALSTPRETRQSTDYIYESWFHSFFSTRDRVIDCHWVLQGGRKQRLSSTTNVISTTQDIPASWEPPFYWIHSQRNFPGIDSALVLTNEIIAIQVTIAEKHESSVEKGLSKLRGLLPQNLKDLRWKVVFVGAEVDLIEDIAKSWADRVTSPSDGKRVRVGWTVVDPVRKDIVYTQYRDEDDPMMIDE